MAVVQNPIIGRAKQKFGNAIFSTWKGINTLRTLPLSVGNPKSAAQKLQRMKLALAVMLYRYFPGIIKIGYSSQAIKQSEYNAFISDMIRNAFIGSTVETVAIEPLNVKIAKGTMAPTPISTASYENHDFTMTWDGAAPLAPSQSASDLAYPVFIAFDASGEVELVVVGTPVARTVGTVTETVNQEGSAENVYQYLFFASADFLVNSDSDVMKTTGD